MTQVHDRRAILALATGAPLLTAASQAPSRLGFPPPGFTSARLPANGLHYVRGGRGPAVILLHGFPEDWIAYRPIMPRLARRFTVVAVDLPGIGKSAPAARGYEKASLAADIHALVQSLKLERAYVVGHDLGGHVAYAYLRRFPDTLRGAMILDVPVPGVPGSEDAGAGFWHVGFIQAPRELAEKLVVGRQADFLGWFYDLGAFTPAERAYYRQAYGAPQLHAAFETYRAFPKDAAWNAARTEPNTVPLVVAVGEKSFTAPFLEKFVEGYRAKGMTHVEGARVAGAGHYVTADNPQAVAELIERYGART